MSGDTDQDFSDDEMRRMTGIPDMVLMPMSEPRGHIPEGYQIAESDQVATILFPDSGQVFDVWCRPFLDALGQKGTIGKACAAAGITRREYRLAMQFQHGFAEAVDDARAEFADRLEDKILEVFELERENIPMDPKSFALAYRVLQAHAPERFGARRSGTTKAMTDEQRRFLIAQLVQQGISNSEAMAVIDAATNAIKIASVAQ